MYRASIFILWLVLAWVTPAAFALALGWSSVWGSGSVLVDYLVPIPVAGGVLHLPSFIAVSLLLFAGPLVAALGGYLRGLLLAGALVGVVSLFDLNQLHLAATTSMLGGRVWQQNPLGLFILTDCAIAQLFVGALGGRWPLGTREWGVSLAAVVALPLAYSIVSLETNPRRQDAFVYTGTREGPQRGDEMAFYYAKLPLGSDAFRQAATAVLARHDPSNNVNSEDIAVFFFDSLAPAQAFNPAEARHTVCLYQDGTATTWNPGRADCFSQHESFSERFEKASRSQSAQLPPDVRSWLGRRQACAGQQPRTGPNGQPADNKATRLCDPASTERARQELLVKFEQDAIALAALR